MKTLFKTIDELIETDCYCPLPIGVIPNNMGINLCSVEAISWQKQDDGQLTSLTIHFSPDDSPSTLLENMDIKDVEKYVRKNKLKKIEIDN